MIETYCNDFSVTVSAGILSTATTVTVTAAAPIASGFRILIGAELMQVTAGGTTTTWTITRGIEGTSAAVHNAGDVVHIVLTSGGLDALRTQINGFGPYANLPSTGMKTGDTFRCSDSLYNFVFDGTTWQPFVSGINVVQPPAINGPSTTLNGGINSSVTTISVSSALSVSTPFVVVIDSEYLNVTSTSGTSWTVTRGYNGTTAASHSSAASVQQINWMWPANGTASGRYAADSTYGYVHMTGSSGGDNLVPLEMALPTAPWTVIVGFRVNGIQANYLGAGLLFRNSSSGALVRYSTFYNSGQSVYLDTWTSATSGQSNTSSAGALYSDAYFLKMTDDGSTYRTAYISRDLKHWITFNQTSRTTGSVPDRCGLGLVINNGSWGQEADFFHWQVATSVI